MTSENKITYVANIYDEIPPKEDGLNDGFLKNKKDRINGRQKLFCRCGGSIEFNLKQKLDPITVEEYNKNAEDYQWKVVQKLPEGASNTTGLYGHVESDSEFEPVICPQCGCLYDNHNQIEVLPTYKSVAQNISRVRTFVFENEKTLALCCFATKIIVNQKTKKLFSKEIKQFISFNKKGKFFIRNGHGRRGVFLRKFGLRFIPNNVLEGFNVFTKIQIDRVSKGMADHEKVDSDMLSGMEEFCHRLMFLLNPKDYNRLSTMLADTFGSELVEMYEEKEGHAEHEMVVKWRHDFIWRYKLPTIMSVIIYPPIATMFFTKGIDFTLGLLNTWIVPSAMILKKEYPTSPIKILETMVKLKMIEDSRNRRSMIKAEKKAEIQSAKKGEQVYPKRYYKYDDKIPDDIKSGDVRVESVKVTKGIYKDMDNPTLADALLFVSLNTEILPKNYQNLMEKYGFEACAIIFRHISVKRGERITVDDVEHVIRLTNKFIEKNTSNKKYKHYHNTFYNITPTPPVDVYFETIRIMNLMERDFSELKATKSFDEVNGLHDRLVTEYEAVKNEILETSIKKSMSKYKFMDCEIDGVSFEVLDSVSGLNNESAAMNNCVRTYAKSVSEGVSVIFKIRNSSDGSKATLGIHLMNKENENGLMFSQLKSVHNSNATQKIKKAVVKFLKVNKIKTDEYHFNNDLSGPRNNESSLSDCEIAWA